MKSILKIIIHAVKIIQKILNVLLQILMPVAHGNILKFPYQLLQFYDFILYILHNKNIKNTKFQFN